VSRLLRRFVDRDLPLATRFQRGLRVGFVVAVALGIATLVLTETTSTSLERDTMAQRDLATQRAEVARLGGLVSLLAGADGAVTANALRIEIGTVVADVERRQIALQIKDDTMATTEVAFGPDRRAVRFDRAFDLAIAQVADTVETLADPALLAGFRQTAVNDAVALLESLDPA